MVKRSFRSWMRVVVSVYVSATCPTVTMGFGWQTSLVTLKSCYPSPPSGTAMPTRSEFTTSSETPVTITNATVTSEIGANCKALVRVSAVIYLPSVNTSTIVGGWIGVFMNGTYVGVPCGVQISATSAFPFGGGAFAIFSENQVKRPILVNTPQRCSSTATADNQSRSTTLD